MPIIPPYRVLPIINDKIEMARAERDTPDRLKASAFLSGRILRLVESIEACPDNHAAYADVFLLGIELAWRAEGSEETRISTELTEAIATQKIKLSPCAARRELAGPYVPRGVDIMAWAVRAAGQRSLSADGFLAMTGRRLWTLQRQSESKLAA